MTEFRVGDHVENLPIATVDGIVYRIEGNVVRFVDEHVTYRMRANDIRLRYEPFDFWQRRAIVEAFPALFRHKCSHHMPPGCCAKCIAERKASEADPWDARPLQEAPE